MDDLKREILRHLGAEGPLHVVELAETLEDHPVTVDRSCYTLQQDGAIRLVGDGLYTLTEKGEQHL